MDSALPDTLIIAPGSSQVLEVPGHGVGGYLWTAQVDSGPGRIEEDVPNQAVEGIGTGVTARFRLTWLGDQKGSVIFRLKRPWEDASIETHIIEIQPGKND